jgi:hypothetical protein
MTGSIARWWVFGVALASAAPAFAQSSPAFGIVPVATKMAVSQPGEIHGVIHDERGQPLNKVVVSASVQGAASLFAVSDADGRFSFRSLKPGAYLVRAYLAGYTSPRGKYVTVSAGGREMKEISLNRVERDGGPPALAPPNLLAAGVGGVPAAETPVGTTGTVDGDEVAWRLRQLRRGPLKDALTAAVARGEFPFDEPAVVAASQQQASLPTRLFALFDTVNGQLNLLTTSSFSRPQDLFDASANAPRPIAFVSLVAPFANGDWAIRGSMTEGDIASWILAGSFTRHQTATHNYQVGLSYATQRYQGGNAEALAAMRDGSRNVGEISAVDSWRIGPQLTLSTGGRYASYDYLSARSLVGGRFSMAFQASPTDPLLLRVTASHRELAPGAEEFIAPAAQGLWLPPERTFAPLSRTGELQPEKVDVVELSGERPVGGGVVVAVRAFRQQVDDQLVTLFGYTVDGAPSLGHYRVASAGDFENYGWGFTVMRHLAGSTQASVDYTMTDTQKRGVSSDWRLLRLMAPDTLRRDENVHDLTATVNSRLPLTATRFAVAYKLNSAYASAMSRSPEPAARFDVQINQEMPFLDFTGARWEALVGVRNLFRTDLYEGSVYDELLVVRPPKRITGGLTVRF